MCFRLTITYKMVMREEYAVLVVLRHLSDGMA